ncbi:dimethyladenosine transferase [Chthonomonas calidirosea]|uniref:16S rRNA (adenine(1518)-N(6)/adenine(1519)-N(6))- dimethyltransferase RsmA n=1 Tax=Chthonomonas calidirosea TaxID=454171 RepID=UPI0006DD495F|nr:16S rRNA (adenine(1518)-N(6)/adenine(1519)-N(6))-dimethyltransferase RsmA [Chthonomonas calidirosea]CEK18615.1 dimethyladenosine transferase [Chthonomonas calidirosea]
MHPEDFQPTSLNVLRAWLREHRIHPSKRLGQNFLFDRNTLQRILLVADLRPEEPVLEIGAGFGALTQALAEQGARVTAIEVDSRLKPPLQAIASRYPTVHLVFADFLELDLDALLDMAFGVGSIGSAVSNIPYSISTPLVERLLSHKNRFRQMILLVQEEFARRIVAKPGSKDYGSLSVFVQYHATAEIAGVVPRTVFFPQPEVHSAILKIVPVSPSTQPVENERRFFSIVHAAFGQRRKTLLKALLAAASQIGLPNDRARVAAWLSAAKIAPERRGETLSLEEFARLANTPPEPLNSPEAL